MTSGAYRWDDRNHFPLGVSIQASIPLTRVFLSDGGAVAVNKRAWYRLVRIPVVVPLANPPRPSTSSHSAESETSDMGRIILVSAPRQVPLPASEIFESVDKGPSSKVGAVAVSRQSYFTFSTTRVSLQDVRFTVGFALMTVDQGGMLPDRQCLWIISVRFLSQPG